MVARGKRRVRLQDRDYDILEHVNRYRLTTREDLLLRFFDNVEPNAVTKVTSRLCEAGYLARHPFIGPATYFVLGDRGGRLFGRSIRLSKPMNAQGLYMSYAMLLFCSHKHHARHRITVSEIQSDFPQLNINKVDKHRIVRERIGEETRVLALSIDGSAELPHCIRKMRLTLNRWLNVPMIAALADQKRFAFACMTYSEQRRSRILEKLIAMELPCHVQVECSQKLEELLIVENV